MRKWRQARLCSIWVLRYMLEPPYRLPRDVVRYILEFTAWECAYCWICLRPIPIRVPAAANASCLYFANDDKKPACQRELQIVECYKTYESRPPALEPHQERSRLITLRGPSWEDQLKSLQRTYPDIGKLLEAFDFLSSLTDDGLPVGWNNAPYGDKDHHFHLVQRYVAELNEKRLSL